MDLIASHDDLIKLCGTDLKLSEKYKEIFGETDAREVTFDAVLSAASNPELLAKKSAFLPSRKVGSFNVEKYTKYFVEVKGAHFKDAEKCPDILRTGFDAYAYYMAYEDEINAAYESKEDMSALQKATLHFVEVGREEKEVDYLRHIATYDDLIQGAVMSRPSDTPWEQWLPQVGKISYETEGKQSIMAGIRPITGFFDPIMYAASYPQEKPSFVDVEGKLDSDKICISFIVNSVAGRPRSQFAPYVFLANYPDALDKDIYNKQKEIDTRKVATVWLDYYSADINLNTFDPQAFLLAPAKKGAKALVDGVDPYVAYVDQLVEDHFRALAYMCFAWPRLSFTVSRPTLPTMSMSLPSRPRFFRAKAPVDAPVVAV